MPKIDTYDRRISIPGQGTGVTVNPSAFTQPTKALQESGKDIGGISDILVKRAEELKKQEDDNYLTAEGTNISKSFIEFNSKIEQDPQYLSGNYAGMNKSLADFSKTQADTYKDTLKDRPDLMNKIQSHISALEVSSSKHFSNLAGQRIKTNGEVVRKNDLDVSLQYSQAGNYELGLTNYKKTLDTQKANGLLSPEMYDLELKTGRSAIVETHIKRLLDSDPLRARSEFNAFKSVTNDNGETALTSDAIDRLEKIIKPAVIQRNGMDIGTEIFKANTSGKLEDMTDTIRARNLDAETEKAAVHQAKELYSERETDKRKIKEAAIEKVNKILVPIALGRGDGLNKMSDLTPAQWAELQDTNPEYAAKLQDTIRKEWDYKRRQDRVETRAEREDLRLRQIENANLFLSDPESLKRENLDSLLVTGQISRDGYNFLKKIRENNDPRKSNQAKLAFKMIDDAKSKKIFNSGDAADNASQWANYSRILGAYVENKSGQPDYDPIKFSEEILQPVKTKISEDALDFFKFGTPGTEKALERKRAELKQKAGIEGNVGKVLDVLPPADQYKGKTAKDTATGKRYKSDGTKWTEVK